MGLNNYKHRFNKLVIDKSRPKGLGKIHSSFKIVFSSYDYDDTNPKKIKKIDSERSEESILIAFPILND